MEFLPEESEGKNLLFFFILFIDILTLFTMSMTESFYLNLLIGVLVTFFNIYSVYYLILMYSLKYKLDKDYLIIEGAYGLKKVFIKISDIKSYYKNITQFNDTNLFKFKSNRFALGKGYNEQHEPTEFFVTSSKRLFLLQQIKIILQYHLMK